MRGKQLVVAATTATKVHSNVSHRAMGWLRITNSAAGALNVGGADVSATVFGQTIAASGTADIFLGPGDDVYVFSTPGATIGILATPGGGDTGSDITPLEG